MLRVGDLTILGGHIRHASAQAKQGPTPDRSDVTWRLCNDCPRRNLARMGVPRHLEHRIEGPPQQKNKHNPKLPTSSCSLRPLGRLGAWSLCKKACGADALEPMTAPMRTCDSPEKHVITRACQARMDTIMPAICGKLAD